MSLFGGGNSSNTNQSTTNNFDQRSVVTNTLDGGAIAGAMSLAGGVVGTLGNAIGVVSGLAKGSNDLASQSIDASSAATAHAYDYADNLFTGAIGFAAQNAAGTASAYDHAAATETAAIGMVQNAYADSKGTTQAQQQVILAVLAVAAVAIYSARK